MGQCAIPFGVDIEKVKKLFGSKDQTLFEKVKKDTYYIHYDKQTSNEEELEDIIFNYVPIDLRVPTKSKLFGLIGSKDGSGMYSDWNSYGYVLMAICNIVGHDISPDNEIFYWGDNWDRINKLLRDNGSKLDLDRMTKYRKIFDTPFEESEVCSSYYDKQEVKDFLVEVNKIEGLIGNEDEEVIELYAVLKNGLEYCSQNNCEWVSFLV